MLLFIPVSVPAPGVALKGKGVKGGHIEDVNADVFSTTDSVRHIKRAAKMCTEWLF